MLKIFSLLVPTLYLMYLPLVLRVQAVEVKIILSVHSLQAGNLVEGSSTEKSVTHLRVSLSAISLPSSSLTWDSIV